jgi:hypothetical protein
MPMSLALSSKAQFFISPIVGILGSNFTESIRVDVRLLCVCFFVWVVKIAASLTKRTLVQRIPTGCV